MPRQNKSPDRAVLNRKAFSLAEMLMALLVASLLLAALAPVITKRYNEKMSISGSGNSKAPPNFTCIAYDSGTESFPVKIDNVYYANFILASGGGGGGGATGATVVENLIFQSQSSSTSDKTLSMDITEDLDEVKIDFMTGGGGGGGGGATIQNGNTPSAANCSNYGSGKTDTAGNSGTNFATYDSSNKLCITKFNQTKSSGSGNCWSSYSHANCNAKQPSGQSYYYSGCQRTVCDNAGAMSACKYLASKTGDGWRLPTNNELSKWTSITSRKAIALCDNNSTGVLSWCGASSSYISSYYPAFPYAVWSSTASGSGYNYWDVFGQDQWNGPKTYSPNGPFSTRCVLANTLVYYSISGSGGGGAPSINISNPINETFNEIIKANIGGKIEITAGGGGLGGAKASDKGRQANDGEDGRSSCIRILDKNSIVVYKLCTIGGKKGKKADGSTSGIGTPGGTLGSISTSAGCYSQTSEDGQKSYFNCTSEGRAGTSGLSSTSSPSGGGIGGASNYLGASSSGGSYSGATGITLSDGSNPGSGGGAGRSTNSSGTFAIGAGARGAGGLVKLTYKRKYAGAGGGGGAGGAVAKIENIYVGPKAICDIKIGKGGKGGTMNNNGEDGTSTTVKCDSDFRTFEVTGGKGGKSGTAASENTQKPLGGKGATAFGDANDKIYSIEPKSKEIKKGTSGKDAFGSIGGSGGMSGSKTKGGCGALYFEENVCKVNSENPLRINGESFNYEDIVLPTSSSIALKSFGTAGAGGGGGGWARNINYNNGGKGGDGMSGYACWYWYSETGE